MSWRKDQSLPEKRFDDVEDYYSSVRDGLREKANHNKLESQWCISLTIACSLAAPLFVTLGVGVVWAKWVPSVLSVLAAGLTSWLQVRKPQRLWSIYRRAQRELEREKARFDFKLKEYSNAELAKQTLANRITDIAFRVHERWEGLVPSVDDLDASIGGKKRIVDDDES
jgi:hypothetical protein